tara:strand:- start:38439 stop:39320 length:882 start_codon:yes stop_codon:yes gene_type:complete
LTTQNEENDPVDGLLHILDLERIEVNRFRGFTPDSRSVRVFGGQVIGQALIAAYRTVTDRQCHSLHAYFIRPGNPEIPILYEVDQSRDGRSFTTRRVVAIQNGEQIFNLAASFHVKEPGFEHQFDIPDHPEPEDVPSRDSLRLELADKLPENMARSFRAEQPIDIRPIHSQSLIEPKKMDPINHVWLRLKKRIGDDPALHQAILAYASDMTLLDTCVRPHGVNFFKGAQLASLDHAMWFHEEFRVDDWLFCEQDSPKSFGGRGFNRGTIFTHSGRLVASVTQEGLIRPRSPGN